ncbi:hypothetical protein HAX54_014535, partial [Datura stramonium]|nr:hypothetical protein [Datura stramonium]
QRSENLEHQLPKMFTGRDMQPSHGETETYYSRTCLIQRRLFYNNCDASVDKAQLRRTHFEQKRGLSEALEAMFTACLGGVPESPSSPRFLQGILLRRRPMFDRNEQESPSSPRFPQGIPSQLL